MQTLLQTRLQSTLGLGRRVLVFTIPTQPTGDSKAGRAAPALWAEGRKGLLVQIAMLAVCQAICAGLLAVGVRWSFQALHGEENLPLQALALIATTGLAIALSRWAERTLAEKLGHDYANTIRSRLFVCMANLPSQDPVWQKRSPLLAQRLIGDMGALRAWVSRGQVRLICSAITLPTVVTLLMLWIHPLLAVGVLVPVVLSVVALVWLSRGLASTHRRLRGGRARLSTFVSERASHAQELKLARRLSRELQHMERHAQRLKTLAVTRQKLTSSLRMVPDLARALAIVLVLAACSLTGTSAADAAATLAAVGLLMPALRDIALALDQQAAWTTSRRRLWEMFSQPSPTRQHMNLSQTASPDRNRSHPTLLRLLQAQAACLAPITHVLMRGDKVCLFGPMGSGKSSVLRLLAGLLSPNGGLVEYAAAPKKGAEFAASRVSIHYLGAHSILLSGSLRRNLTLGAVVRPDDTLVHAVATTFGLAPLLHRLGGLDGKVLSSAQNLSRTEARRILLIRAMLCGADLVLIDDLDELLDAQHLVPFEAWLAKTPKTVVYATRNNPSWLMHNERWQLDDHELRVISNDESNRLVCKHNCPEPCPINPTSVSQTTVV